jgi:hypothetical protein
VGLPPAWVDVSEEIATNVQRARIKMAELAKAHAKALMPSFGDGKEDQRLIESLTQEITGLIKRSEKKLQRLSAAGPSEDSNVRKNVQVWPAVQFVAYHCLHKYVYFLSYLDFWARWFSVVFFLILEMHCGS